MFTYQSFVWEKIETLWLEAFNNGNPQRSRGRAF